MFHLKNPNHQQQNQPLKKIKKFKRQTNPKYFIAEYTKSIGNLNWNEGPLPALNAETNLHKIFKTKAAIEKIAGKKFIEDLRVDLEIKSMNNKISNAELLVLEKLRKNVEEIVLKRHSKKSSEETQKRNNRMEALFEKLAIN